MSRIRFRASWSGRMAIASTAASVLWGCGSMNPEPGNFACEGKTRCTEMTSCEEAKFYLKNCPGVEIDGDGVLGVEEDAVVLADGEVVVAADLGRDADDAAGDGGPPLGRLAQPGRT